MTAWRELLATGVAGCDGSEEVAGVDRAVSRLSTSLNMGSGHSRAVEWNYSGMTLLYVRVILIRI